MVMYAEGWRPVYVLLFVAMCCPQSRRFWASGKDRSQVDNSATHPTSARNEDSTKRARELFRQGADLIEKDRFAAAIPLLRQAVDLDPQEARIHHYLGYALWKTRQWSAASAEFETAHKLEPGNPYTEYFQARIAYSEGYLDRAVHLYEAALRETVAVGLAEGVRLPPDSVEKGMAMMRSMPPYHMTSMGNDLLRGSRLELPWFAGKVVELGRRHGIPTPVNDFVYAALKLYAAGSA